MSADPPEESSPLSPPSRPGEEPPQETASEQPPQQEPPQATSPPQDAPPKQDAPPVAPSATGGAPPPDPNGGAPAPPPGGGSPPGNGGSKRRIKWKRVLGAGLAVVLLVGVIGGIVLMGPSVPGVDGLLGCSAPDPAATIASFQSTGSDGTRLAVQATSLNDTDYISVAPPTGDAVNLTSVGNTTTLTGLSTGESVSVSAVYECGTKELETITVR